MDFGRYKGLEEKYVGGYGTIFKAWDSRDDSFVAIKRQTNQKEDKSLPCYVLREFDFMAKMNHPNIIRPKQFIYTAKHSWLITPWVQETLSQYVKRKSIAELRPKLPKIWFQILDAVSALHESEVFHYDIKPGNIMYDEDSETVYLIDFGLCSFKIGEYDSVCTIPYRPPELVGIKATSRIWFNSNVDIWSLGCVFAETITGKTLFDVRDEEEIKLMKLIYTLCLPSKEDACKVGLSVFTIPEHSKSLYEILSSIAGEDEMVNLVCEALSCDPDKRPSAQDMLKNSLFSNMKRETFTYTRNFPNDEDIPHMTLHLKIPTTIMRIRPRGIHLIYEISEKLDDCNGINNSWTATAKTLFDYYLVYIITMGSAKSPTVINSHPPAEAITLSDIIHMAIATSGIALKYHNNMCFSITDISDQFKLHRIYPAQVLSLEKKIIMFTRSVIGFESQIDMERIFSPLSGYYKTAKSLTTENAAQTLLYVK